MRFTQTKLVLGAIAAAVIAVGVQGFIMHQRAIGALQARLTISDSILAVQADSIARAEAALTLSLRQLALADSVAKAAQKAQRSAYASRDSARAAWDLFLEEYEIYEDESEDPALQACVAAAQAAIAAERRAGSACDLRVAAESLKVVRADSARMDAQVLAATTTDRMQTLERQNIDLRDAIPSTGDKVAAAGKWAAIGGGAVWLVCKLTPWC